MAEPTRPRNPFRPVTFGGYHREDVDAYLAEAEREQQQRDLDLATVKAQLEQLAANFEAQEQDHALAISRSASESGDLRAQMRALRDELEKCRIELSKATERADSIVAERDNYQRIAEKLSAEEQQTRDLLRAVSRTAEVMHADAKREATEMVQRAEQSARRIEDDARRRVEDMRKEYEQARQEYDEFLKQARDLADILVRRFDEARAKWPV